MNFWFYYNADGQKQGAVTDEILKGLADTGKITPETMLEHAKSGEKTIAAEVKWLPFGEPGQISTQPAPPLFVAQTQTSPEPANTSPQPLQTQVYAADKKSDKDTKSLSGTVQNLCQKVLLNGKMFVAGICSVTILIFAILMVFSTDKTSNVSVKDILERLQSEVATIDSIIIATEETDPNNKLNKRGEYIELGWFVDSRIEKNEFDDRFGVYMGGGIEKFRNEDDAKKREKLLESVLGTPFSPGYHERRGVFVIRISDRLTASQQSELTEKIKRAIR